MVPLKADLDLKLEGSIKSYQAAQRHTQLNTEFFHNPPGQPAAVFDPMISLCVNFFFLISNWILHCCTCRFGDPRNWKLTRIHKKNIFKEKTHEEANWS